MSSNSILDRYGEVAGADVMEHLRQLARPLKGMEVVHINSTRAGGGVAEILYKLVPLMNELGIDTRWEVIEGESRFYECTKAFHNGLQGSRVDVSEGHFKAYEKANETAAERLGRLLQGADAVFVHDPQPAALIRWFPEHRGKWIWRCHIDLSRPFRPVWRYLSVFSLAPFAQRLPHPTYLIAPSIDPLHDKNVDLDESEVLEVFSRFGLDPERPLVLQVSRYDKFKDPVGVIHAYRLAKQLIPSLQLALAGGGASDDPEGEAVLQETRLAARDDSDVKVLLLPADAHRTVNALQRAGDIVVQKSLREGFGLTVTEALWKKKPVVGGDTGGIRIQVINHHTGFLVSTPEGAALRILYLLQNPGIREEIGAKAKEFVRDNFLITRQLREYLTLILALNHGKNHRVELG
jgi:trehalose synthase